MFALPLPEWLIERAYSRGFYPVWQRLITPISNVAPFALFDALLVLVVLGCLWRLMRVVSQLRQRPAAALWDGTRRLLRAASAIGIVFLVMWGFNYRRLPLDRTVPPARPSVADLRGLIADASTRGAALRATSPSDVSFDDLAARLHPALDDALASVGRPALSVAGRPKRSILMTPFFTAAGVDGMVDPFFLETIVHPDLLPFERPFVVAHEWAHLAGSADEAEASAIGWLACVHGDPALAYSGTFYLIMEAAAALPRRDWLEIRKNLDPGILADLGAVARRQQRQRREVQQAAFRAYDSYLRANRVDDGVASYSRALSLIVTLKARDDSGRLQPARPSSH
jgi:hypothetical protein